ncbi:MAG: hypothetical protein HY939_06835 [Gammaproteobacteria bacterium]|nr:hypothetical protein [Gammaproteobacteria bacterium]
MFKKMPVKMRYFSFFRIHFLEVWILVGLLAVSMIGIFYYFKHHSINFFGFTHQTVSEHTIYAQPDSQRVAHEQDPDFEFYTLLADGNSVLSSDIS